MCRLNLSANITLLTALMFAGLLQAEQPPANRTLARFRDMDQLPLIRKEPREDSPIVHEVKNYEIDASIFWLDSAESESWSKITIPGPRQEEIQGYVTSAAIAEYKIPIQEYSKWDKNRDDYGMQCIDQCCIFKDQYGDGGWQKGFLKATSSRENFNKAIAYLDSKDLKYSFSIEGYCRWGDISEEDNSSPISIEYLIIWIVCKTFDEDDLVATLRTSGLFEFASRVPAGAGGGDLVLNIQESLVFPNRPNSRDGAKFVETIFRRLFSGRPDVVVSDLETAADFDYRLTVTGNGEALASADRLLWEKHKFQITLGRTLNDVGPGRIQLELGLIDSKSAKGPRTEMPPPGRFEPMAESYALWDFNHKVASMFLSFDGISTSDPRVKSQN